MILGREKTWVFLQIKKTNCLLKVSEMFIILFEIATHRFLQLHAKHPLIEGTGCPHVIGFKGVTQSDDQKTFYYWQEAGAETVATIIDDGKKTFEKSLRTWYTGCKEEAKNGGKKNRYMTERSP